MSWSVRRVPPPPPPGFGDEEYYRLYGRPEDYHRYNVVKDNPEKKTPRSNRSRSSSLESGEEVDDEDDAVHTDTAKTICDRPNEKYYRNESQEHNRPESSPELSSLDDADVGSENGSRPYTNFRVTINNESEGTPSLSDTDEENFQGRRILEAPLESKGNGFKRRSVKDRLGKRVSQPRLPPARDLASPITIDSSSETSSSTTVSDSDTGQDSSPIPHKRSRDIEIRGTRKDGRRRLSENEKNARSSTSHRNKQRSPRQASTSKDLHSRKRDEHHRRSESDRGQNHDPVAVTTNAKKRRQKRKKNRRSGGGGRGLQERIRETNKQNEAMLQRLARKNRAKKGSESNQVANLARLAGIEIPESALPKQRRRGEERSKTQSKKEKSRREQQKKPSVRKSPPTKSNMRSDEVLARRGRGLSKSPTQRRRGRRSRADSPSRWKHDKFTAASPDRDQDVQDDFGDHWKRIRSEKSKERDRRGSGSRSRSRSRKRHRNSSGSNPSHSSTSRSRSQGRYGARRRRRSSFGSSASSRSSYSRSSSYSSSRSRSPASSVSSSSSIRSIRRARAARRREAKEKLRSIPNPHPKNPLDGKELPSKEGRIEMSTSGKLLEDTNVINGVTVKYREPDEAKRPKTKWRLYVFKGDEELPVLYIHRQSAYLLGRDRKVADIPLDHPSCSKQHAVLQYRLVEYTKADSSRAQRVVPYVIDLGSANGTFVNNQKIEKRKYVQVMEKDVLKFGFSSREYVLLHDQSKGSEENDPGMD